ncbi:hypothetical protein [Chryseolinea sp. T2]
MKRTLAVTIRRANQMFESHPTRLAQPVGGTLEWFLDDGAAKLFPES